MSQQFCGAFPTNTVESKPRRGHVLENKKPAVREQLCTCGVGSWLPTAPPHPAPGHVSEGGSEENGMSVPSNWAQGGPLLYQFNPIICFGISSRTHLWERTDGGCLNSFLKDFRSPECASSLRVHLQLSSTWALETLRGMCS